jgi:hypothetical protein
MSLEVRRIVTGHDEFGKGIVVSDEEADSCVARPWSQHLSLRDLVDEFHASRQLYGSRGSATGRLRQEIQFCRKRSGDRDADCRVGARTRYFRTVPRPWTIQSCCQARSMSSSTADRWSQ